MANDPILSREFNATIQALRDKQNEFQEAILKSLEDGFASVKTRFDGLERETDRLSDLALKQAEHNGAMMARLKQAQSDIQAEKNRGDKHNGWIIGAMASLLLLIIGGIINWVKMK